MSERRARYRTRLPAEVEAEIVRQVRAGATQRAVGAVFDLNPVTVGKVARRHGITYPKAAKQAAARRGLVLLQPEQDWQEQVIALAELHHYRAYHTWNSQHSVAGFPDLVLARPPRLIIAELKAETTRLMPAQKTWLATLALCPAVEVYVFRPCDAQIVADILGADVAPDRAAMLARLAAEGVPIPEERAP